MRKKRVLVIGPAGCGKTALVQALEGRCAPPRKMAAPVYGKMTIDCPSAYLENPCMYKHLIALAQDAAHVLLLLDAAGKTDVYSPGFARIFGKPAAGVLTKLDLAPEKEERCRKRLYQTGASPIFCLNAPKGTGVEEIKTYLLGTGREEPDGETEVKYGS